MPKNLIAQVATAVIVNGERMVIQPGEALPDLPEHDGEALVSTGSAIDADDAKKQARLEEKTEARALGEFAAAREAVKAEAASIAPAAAKTSGK